MNNDIFKRTFCKKCNFKYDPHLESCPKCKEKNDDFIQNRCRNPLFFLDLPRCIIIILTWLILMYVIPVIIGSIVQAVNPEILVLSEFVLGLNLGIYLVGFGIFGYLLFYYKDYIFKDFKNWKHLLIGVIAGALIVGLSQLVNFLIFDLGEVVVNSNQETVTETIKNSTVLAFFVIVIFGPIFEELVYRVGLMGIGMKLNQKYGKVFAYIISVLIFILVHLNFFGENVNIISEISAIPGYFIGATLLCVAYDKGGIVSSIIAHILNNLVGYILVMVL